MTLNITAAADGSALGNPGPAGWAWYIDDANWAAGGWDHGTNNMGELKAVLDLFEATAHLDDAHLTVICDSQYVINSVTKWMPGWKKKGWKKSDGKPVLNVDLMKELDAALAGRSYTFEWVKGHTGHPLNEQADSRANAAAKAHQQGSESDTGPGYTGQDAPARGTQPTAASTVSGANSSPAIPSMAPQSSVDSQPAVPAGADALAQVRAQEEQLAKASVYGSQKLVSGLLASDFSWVVPAGNLVDRATVLEHRERAFALATEPVYLAELEPAPGTVLLVSVVRTARGEVTRSSTWSFTSGSWRLTFRQDTSRTR